MEEPVDRLVYSKRLREPRGEISLFNDKAKFIKLPPPPQNSSLDATKDIMTVKGAIRLCGTGMLKSIRKHDKDPVFAIKVYMSVFGLEYDKNYIQKVMDEAAILIKEQKNFFNRPRPYQLAPYFGIDLEPLNSRSSRSPSYPGGHSTQARLIAEIYCIIQATIKRGFIMLNDY